MGTTTKRYHTIDDLVRMGLASRTTIWKLIRSGELPAIKVGRSVRIPADEFDAWCDNLRVVGAGERR